MPGPLVLEHLAVDAQALAINVPHAKTGQDAGIALILHLLGQHALDRLFITRPVSVVEPLVRMAERLAVEEHRPLLARSLRNAHQQHRLALQRQLLHIGIGQQIGADLARVVQVVEQVCPHLGRVGNACNGEHPLLLAHPQQHHAPMGIGHGRVGGPEILGHFALAVLPLGELASQLHRLAQQGQVFEGGG